MSNYTLFVLTFVLLSSVSLLSMHWYPRLAERHRNSATAATVSKIANIFVVITSLVFGLLIASAKNTFEVINRNQHNYGTDLILLDHLLRDYGPDASEARRQLRAYAEKAIAHPARVDEMALSRQDMSGHALDEVGRAIDAIQPADLFHQNLLADAQNQYRNVVNLRWVIVEQSEGSIPPPLKGMLVAWLTLIFASYGYRAPENRVVISMLLISAALIAGSFYLVLDMDTPYEGAIQISDQPIRRALIEMQMP